MSVEFVDEQAGKAAIADVRSDATDTDWCVFSYENPKSQKIVLLGKGSGGLTELLSNLNDDIVGYGLVRKTDRIDDSTTVKFAHIMWLGENVPRMQKARISVHQGKMREFIGQFHVDITASNKNEVTDEIIMEKISDASGSGSRVVDKNGAKVSTTSSGSSKAPTSSSVNKAKQSLEFADQNGIKDLIARVRSDADPLTWLLVTYEGEDSNTLILLGSGTGDVDSELAPLLQENVVAYGLVRKTEKIDDSVTVKFAFIRFVGNNIHRMLKARLGTHFGTITAFFNPYHVSIDATTQDEVSDAILEKTIKNAAGTAVHVKSEVSRTTTGASAATKAVAPGAQKAPVIPKSVPTSDNQSIKYQDENQTKDDIKDVRSDSTATNWVLVGYEGGKGNVLVTLGKGDGGVDELKSHLQDNIVAYGLVRKTEKIDDSVTVKFAFIQWTGENIDRMHRARIGTHKGAVSSLFSPYHVDLNITSLNEISDDIVETRIGEFSGTKSKVKN